MRRFSTQVNVHFQASGPMFGTSHCVEKPGVVPLALRFGSIILGRFAVLKLAILMLAMSILGCGGDSENQSNGDSSTNGQIDQKTIDVASLPIGEPLPPGVSPRVEILAPKDWFIPGRTTGYLAWFVETRGEQVPLVSVKETELTSEEFATVDDDNAAKFAESVKNRLESEDRELLEPIVLLDLQGKFFVRYVLEGKAGSSLIERQILETNLGGHQYLVELRVQPGDIVTYRDHGYAVAAGLKMLDTNVADSDDSDGSNTTEDENN